MRYAMRQYEKITLNLQKLNISVVLAERKCIKGRAATKHKPKNKAHRKGKDSKFNKNGNRKSAIVGWETFELLLISFYFAFHSGESTPSDFVKQPVER